MNIGSIKLDNPFILAPLAGYTDIAFRTLCREYGASLCYSEMISCHGLVYKQKKTEQLLASHSAERPVAMQLFGADPNLMGQAAAIVSKLPIDIIDINMGCPVRKVVKKGSGSALMKTPELAQQIIEQVCSHTDKPVTVKFRSGWTHQDINAPEFAVMAEKAGASAVTVHGRTWSDGFSGSADWQIIAEVKKRLSIPVIGNGDIHSYADGLKMMEQTGCDAVMIGRATLGAPWIFDKNHKAPTLQTRTKALLRHLQLIENFFPVDRILFKVKNHACRYYKEERGSAEIRKKINSQESFKKLQELIASFTEAKYRQ